MVRVMSMETSRLATGARVPTGRRPEAAARQSMLREHNLSLVLQQVVSGHATRRPVSRAAIAGAVGLSRATVSDLADRLISAGLVAELEPLAAARAGRPAVPLVPAARSVVGLGLSVGVDHLSALVVDLTGLTVSERVVEVDLRACDPDTTLGRLADLAAETLRAVVGDGMEVAGVCVALPGLVSRETSVLRYAPNLDWRDIVVDASLGRHPDLASLRIAAANDADLSARCEIEERLRRFGTPVDVQNFLFVYGAVGIGSAVVLAGRPLQGMHGWSGEIGHVVVDPTGRACSCGAVGCLEAYAGREAMARAAGLPTSTGAMALADAASGGPAAAAVSDAARALARAASTVVNLVDVDEIVLGGGYATLFDRLVPDMLPELDQRAVIARWSTIRVTRAIGGASAAARGAALTVLDDVVADPARWIHAE